MITIIIAIATLIIGYFAGVYYPLKFRKDDRKPKISIGPFQDWQNYFDITNHGGDILNLTIKIIWVHDGKKQERKMEDFFTSTENPVHDHPHKCNSIKKNETKKVINCPTYSDDGKVKVIINGVDLDGEIYSVEPILENHLKPNT
jgi:hypothetical protein